MGVMNTVKGWFGAAKEQGSEPASKTEPHVEKAKDHGAELADATEDFAHDAMDKATTRVDDFRSMAEATVAAAAITDDVAGESASADEAEEE